MRKCPNCNAPLEAPVPDSGLCREPPPYVTATATLRADVPRLVEQVRLRKLGYGKAAELAGMPIAAFLDEMGKAGVSAWDYDPGDLEVEVGSLDRWLHPAPEAGSRPDSGTLSPTPALVANDYCDVELVHRHLVSTPDICGGALRIKGTRITVQLVKEMLADGVPVEEILYGYPHLTREDIEACREADPQEEDEEDAP